jgi:hypothetical protein
VAMRAFAAVLLGVISACRPAHPETEARVRDCHCGAVNCCEDHEELWVETSGAEDRKRAALEAWLLPEGGSAEPAEAAPRNAPTRGGQPLEGPAFVVHCCEETRRQSGKRPKPVAPWCCYRQWSDGGIQPCEPLDSCL